MKRSGKSRTNKLSGGRDPSTRRIATYEQFKNLNEGIKWWKNGKIYDDDSGDNIIDKKRDKYIGMKIFRSNNNIPFGEIISIENKITVKNTNYQKFILSFSKFNEYEFKDSDGNIIKLDFD